MPVFAADSHASCPLTTTIVDDRGCFAHRHPSLISLLLPLAHCWQLSGTRFTRIMWLRATANFLVGAHRGHVCPQASTPIGRHRARSTASAHLSFQSLPRTLICDGKRTHRLSLMRSASAGISEGILQLRPLTKAGSSLASVSVRHPTSRPWIRRTLSRRAKQK